MKRLLLILILTLSFQLWTQADDIKDLEIEGFSIGDSLLDFVNLKKIKEKINSYSDKGYIYKSKKYYALTFDQSDFNSNFELYDQVQFHFKDKDNSFTIESIAGIKLYINNIDQCYSFLELREKEADEMFSNFDKTVSNRSNEGKVNRLLGYFYELPDKSTIYIACEDWTDESNIPDGFVLVLNTSAHQNWVNNEAYK